MAAITEQDGSIIEAYCQNAMFQVELENGHVVTAHSLQVRCACTILGLLPGDKG
jgi:translation initiation factor IF-1